MWIADRTVDDSLGQDELAHDWSNLQLYGFLLLLLKWMILQHI